MDRLSRYVVGQWHRPTLIGQCLLRPLAGLFALAAASRRGLYAAGLRRQRRLAVPILVVGNLTVGGSGKTPLVEHLVAALVAAGWSPGIVSRGYRGVRSEARRVPPAADPADYGDEPVLLAAHTGRPVAVGVDRAAAAALLREDCDVIVADDGLQHYALARDVEIAVVDGGAGLGNRRLLPAGPLREPAWRLQTVDYVAVRDGDWPGAWRYRVVTGAARRLSDGRRAEIADWAGQRVHAVAGIGVPGRFFGQLERAGIDVIPHAFADHHRFTGSDFAFDDGRAILMTDKDAVKCKGFADERMWAIEARVSDADGLGAAVCRHLAAWRRDRGPSTA